MLKSEEETGGIENGRKEERQKEGRKTKLRG